MRYEYDAHGRVTPAQHARLLNGPGAALHLERRGPPRPRPVRPATPGATSTTPLGRRIAKHRLAPDGTVVERVDFTWDGILLAEQSATSPGGSATATTWEWQLGEVRPLVQHGRSAVADAPQEWIDAEFSAIVTDLVGAPEFLVKETGERSAAESGTLWKRALHGAACPLGFPGQYEDAESGLSYNVFRHYDSTTAAYACADPVGLAAGHNSRAYVSNPTTWMDPLGLTAHDYGGVATAATAPARKTVVIGEGMEDRVSPMPRR